MSTNIVKDNEEDDYSENMNSENVKNKRFSRRRIKILLIFVLIMTPIIIIALGYTYLNTEPSPTQTVMIRSRDGIDLATDLYIPEEETKFPAILYRTPYGKEIASGMAKDYLSYGIVLVSQDHRACYDSDGDYTAFGSDGRDAEDTVNWLKNQTWFNGLYGTVGGSAMGITQYMQVPYLDDLACQFIQIATPDIYGQGLYQGGAPRKMLAENWLNGIGHGDYYYEIFDHPLSTDEFAKEHRIDDDEWSNVVWPSIHMGGWYDCFCQGIIDGFSGYQYSGGLGGAGNAKLIMGPWTHQLSTSTAGELVYPDNAAEDPYAYDIYLAMFAERLLGLTDVGDYRTFPAVTYYVMGDVDRSSENWNRWATADAWPIPHVDQEFYFIDDNTLSLNKPESTAELSYVFDPSNPVETKGGANLMGDNRGPFNQAEIENGRKDLLQFDYEVSEDVLITGRITGNLYVKSNCTDTDFTMKLCDVYPDGKQMLIADGIVRMRYREGQDKQLLMDGSDSTIYQAEVDLWSTSYVFAKGHKIRVSISSSNYPRFDLNPNTGQKIEYVDSNTPYYDARNTIIMSPAHSSSIILPVSTESPNFV